MAKYRIREITELESNMLFGIGTYEHGFCLIDKHGDVYRNEDGNVPVYLPSAYAVVRAMEAYCYLQAYAEANGISFKEYDIASLVNETHSGPELEINKSPYTVQIMHSTKVFDGMNFSKPVKKLQSELASLYQQMQEVEKRFGKLQKLISKEFEEPEKEKISQGDTTKIKFLTDEKDVSRQEKQSTSEYLQENQKEMPDEDFDMELE